MVVKRNTAAGPAWMVLALVVLVCVVMAAPAPALEGSEPIIEETYEITLNDVGDAQVVDSIEYVNPDDYDLIKGLAEENPKYLSRRYTDDTSIGGVENFEVDLDDSSHSVILSFETPGYAYNMKEYWMVPGISTEAKEGSGNKYETGEQYVWNNEFTMFTDQVVDVTTVIGFPAGATDIEYDGDEKVMKYVMPAADSELGFFTENRTLLLIIFGCCALLFLALLVLVLTRKAEPGSAGVTPVAGAPGATPAAVQPPPSSPAPPEPAPEVNAPHRPAEPAARYCKNCGAPIAPGKKFCSRCGGQA